MEKNQFRLADVILSVICVVFVAEAAAPVASIGNSQYFWWIFMILAFLLPYGLIAAAQLARLIAEQSQLFFDKLNRLRQVRADLRRAVDRSPVLDDLVFHFDGFRQ